MTETCPSQQSDAAMAEEPDMEQFIAQAQRLSPHDPETFTVGDHRLSPAAVAERLAPYLTEARRARIEEVLRARTYTVATVVEGLINTGNVSAVMRSAEALGYQAFHVVTGGDRFKHSARTASGADKWLDVFAWPSPEACVAQLRQDGYRIVVTHLDETSVPIREVDFTQKTALVFGNERDGVSEAMVAHSDVRCVIPMVGFVESFNISVAAAVSLYHAYHDRLTRQGHHGDLTEAERARLRAVYYMRSVRKAYQILRREVDAPPR